MVTASPFQLLQALHQAYRTSELQLAEGQDAAEHWSGIGFRMGDIHYVVPMGEVIEVLPEPRYTKLPGVKAWVRGVANVRGRLLPVMDLCAFLEVGQLEGRRDQRVLIMEHANLFAGFTVDAVLGLQHFSLEDFQPSGELALSRAKPFVRGCFQREHDWWVFSPHALAKDTTFLDVVA